MENKNFLRHIFSEDIYVIDSDESSIEKATTKDVTQTDPIAVKKEYDVEEEKSELKEDSVTPSPKLKTRGDENSSLLIYNDDAKNEFIGQGDELFLQNILKAIKFNISDAVIINSKKETSGLEEILSRLNTVETILIFGAEDPLLKGDLYLIDSIKNRKSLRCDSLSAIESDKEKKKALWSSLQKLFLK